MILTDGIHVTSDHSLEELHAFAKEEGFPRGRFHGLRKDHPHYDLSKNICLHCILKRDDVIFARPRDILTAAKKISGGRYARA